MSEQGEPDDRHLVPAGRRELGKRNTGEDGGVHAEVRAIKFVVKANLYIDSLCAPPLSPSCFLKEIFLPPSNAFD
ncbi:hypothetical protein AYO44_04795 [Planctomycetaceae bacterium SCGC AG-212-F19]|nr:hypothetical protein AYO44_04795 [Planctomycetaceae bacterium SCGC AG-212-F19]